MKKYLCLEPNCFVWYNDEDALLYNSDNGNTLLTKFEPIKRYLVDLCDIDNLYCIEISHLMSDPNLQLFIKQIEENKLGSFLSLDPKYSKPIALPPVLNLQSDVKKLENNTDNLIGANMLDYLHELVIDYDRLIINTNRDEKTNDLNKFLSALEFSSLSEITLRTINYYDLIANQKLMDQLDCINAKKVFVISPQHFDLHNKANKLFTNSQFELRIKIQDFDSKDQLYLLNEYLNKENLNNSWLFYIESVENLERVNELIEDLKIQHYQLKPVYNQQNMSFFKEYVWTTLDSIDEVKLSKKEIFRNMTLNSHDFGKLTITTNGEIYANGNFESIGNIADRPDQVIYKELTEGKSWLRIRSSQPCCDCVYKWLCPSPSDYELEMKKENLCHIKP